MHNIYSTKFDANLIRTFLAIWDTRSLTVAADALALSQPSVSHALRRLRDHFEDPLFVRRQQMMMPTEKAMELHGPFSQALAAIGRALESDRVFDPAATTRTLRIAMSDVSEVFFLPPLLSWLHSNAPGLTVESVPLRGSEIRDAMRSGAIDLAIGDIPQLRDDCESSVLFDDTLVCLVRAGHPLAADTIDTTEFLALRHIDVGDNAPSHAILEPLLEDLPHQRTIALRMQHQLAVPPIVRQTDLAAIFPGSLAADLNRNCEYRVMALGFAPARVEICIHVHNRRKQDDLVIWVRDRVCEQFSGQAATA